MPTGTRSWSMPATAISRSRRARCPRAGPCRSRRVRRGTPSPADLSGMEAALRLARAASVREEVPVGAVLVRDREIIAAGHNETIHRPDPTAHAELFTMQWACARDGTDRLARATL